MQIWRNRNHPPGKGVWADEPDKAQWVDAATDLDCLIVRNPTGALCGYVGVPPGHPWHGQPYEDVDVCVHGGLTFSSSCQEGGDAALGVCHVPAPGRPGDVWWLGFDCAHPRDHRPTMAAKYAVRGMKAFQGVYRTFDYVQGQCVQLAAQVRGLVSDHANTNWT